MNGTLEYSECYGHRLVVSVEQDLANYYRSIIPKWMSVNRPRWAPHITVVRANKEIPIYLNNWRKYEGEIIKFYYENFIYRNEIYFWLNIWCDKLEEIRKELGLPCRSEYTLPPEGIKKCFHCTIANLKE